jgi:hypothetical protein
MSVVLKFPTITVSICDLSYSSVSAQCLCTDVKNCSVLLIDTSFDAYVVFFSVSLGFKSILSDSKITPPACFLG